MEEPKIDFLDGFKNKKIEIPPLKKKKPFRLTMIKIAIIVLVVFFIIFSNIIFSDNSLLKNPLGFLPKVGFSKIWLAFKGYVLGESGGLKGEDEDRINILLLGMGGVAHEGPYLTDTIILVSFKPSVKKMSLISIPRDLYLPINGYGWRKVNSANAFGEAQEPSQGGLMASQAISDILGMPIDYYIRIDFDGFKKIINDLGGIDVEVEKSFTDSEYPTENFEYQTISFVEGWQKMNGDRALEFSRSRHGTNGENSDFARARRQQKILLAIKNKVLSLSTLINLTKINKTIQNLEESVKTNLNLDEMTHLAKMAEGVKTEDIINFTLNDDPDNFLVSDLTADGAFILRPKSGNFQEISFFINNIFSEEVKSSPLEKTAGEEKKENDIKKTKILILNGTKQNGLAKDLAESLISLGFSTPSIGNAPEQNYEKTVIYKLNKNKKEALSVVKETLSANTSEEMPKFLEVSLPKDETFDFIIVLGEDNVKR